MKNFQSENIMKQGLKPAPRIWLLIRGRDLSYSESGGREKSGGLSTGHDEGEKRLVILDALSRRKFERSSGNFQPSIFGPSSYVEKGSYPEVAKVLLYSHDYILGKLLITQRQSSLKSVEFKP
uniref:Uncharacterized protein n=1 Tax=Vespula pensylvanica TaxID=30213 RepID=A0A834UF88_VESPE|nr:hypothetical protein H0235_003558 [Vespula pensylvanica]